MGCAMIDYIALAIGHGLLAFALLRLALREDVDIDPAIAALNDKVRIEREAASVAGRNARRRERGANQAVRPGERS